MNSSIDGLYMGCVGVVRKVAPKDTGNLAFNATRFVYASNNTFEIYVDQAIAPYMVYTNEPWISPKWHGKKNPNEHWWQQRAVQGVIKYIIEQTGGELV